MSLLLTTPSSLALSATDFFASDLCTVHSTNTKTCNNDWISKPGTCYEDTCCTSFETATSWYYRLAQGSHVIFSLLGLLVIIIYASKYSSKHMLPDNVRVLVNIMLILMFAHSIDMIMIHVYHISQSYKAIVSNPCAVRVQVSFCALFRYTFSFCTLGLAFCQYCLYIDRLLCAFYNDYLKYQKVIQYLLVLKWIILSAGVIAWVYREEDSESYLLSCLNIPLDSMKLCTKNLDSRSRFEINSHFTAAVDVESSEFLYIVTISQAVFIVIYPVLSLSMRFFYEDTPRPLHLTIATLSYVFSIYCFVIPLVMVDYGRKRDGTRRTRIWSHVKLKSVGKEGADNYFGMMKSQWE
ncbi:hypothetical protein GCK72_018962 [Caenorhabditis remanei]|uniref:Uncharacterized protein n=1 Tax=Caenorhabditis remanei TaxID=31234 RepID=A0A6A5GB38_CAERE|nr:hypothetical protein GCK72_018962 [Caenorhabditis remanei]KAF1752407.1 hypothetical protein GCK72_018962 [Caenorhabditis remanei]